MEGLLTQQQVSDTERNQASTQQLQALQAEITQKVNRISQLERAADQSNLMMTLIKRRMMQTDHLQNNDIRNVELFDLKNDYDRKRMRILEDEEEKKKMDTKV